MLQINRLRPALMAVAGIAMLAGCASPPPRPAHPAYIHALSDLRAARWLIEHRPGDWQQTADEIESVRQIDAALHEIRGAAIDDGKDTADHPPVDERPDHRGRIHESIEYMRRARADVSGDEDNGFANGLRDRAIGHIDAAIGSARRVFQDE
jgi:hypothetical protein